MMLTERTSERGFGSRIGRSVSSGRAAKVLGASSRTILAALVVFFLGASSVLAAHRARLSADLEDHLAAGSQAIDIIVHGSRAEVDALAALYNLRVKRHLKSGAVIRVTAGQLAADKILAFDQTLRAGVFSAASMNLLPWPSPLSLGNPSALAYWVCLLGPLPIIRVSVKATKRRRHQDGQRQSLPVFVESA
jgi:hypothetical protein